jgi:mono/diheme cytochrome c family protein
MMISMKRMFLIVSSAAMLLLLAGCGKPPKRTDAELGLNAQQARGRRVFQVYCSSCHHAYSSAGSKGPSLKRLFKKRYLPSGLPANDRFVRQTILGGRGMMPGFGGVLTEKQFNNLMAYLHTL